MSTDDLPQSASSVAEFLARAQLRPVPGPGLVGRSGTTILLAALPDGGDSYLPELIDTVFGGAGGGRRLVRRLAGLVAASDTDLAPFCVISSADELVVFMHGETEVHLRATTGRHETLTGRDSAAWVDRVVRWQPDSIVASVDGADPSVTSHLLDLRDGVVSGAGYQLGQVPAGPASRGKDAVEERDELVETALFETPRHEQPAPAEDPVERDDANDFEVVLLTRPEAAEHDQAGPETVIQMPIVEEPRSADAVVVEVEGVCCKRGHLNDPHALFCALCGIGMVQQTLNVIKGARPSLGVLVCDDGAAYLLDGDYVLGREPGPAAEVVGGQARPLVLSDTSEIVSRVHASVQLKGWDVEVCDRGSANGTKVIPQGATEAVDLVAHQPVTIRPGTRVILGGQRTLVFNSHRQA